MPGGSSNLSCVANGLKPSHSKKGLVLGLWRPLGKAMFRDTINHYHTFALPRRMHTGAANWESTGVSVPCVETWTAFVPCLILSLMYIISCACWVFLSPFGWLSFFCAILPGKVYILMHLFATYIILSLLFSLVASLRLLWESLINLLMIKS